MRLADFILQNMESIVGRWEAFAATQFPAAHSMNSRDLRDHAQKILEAIAKDLRTYQTTKEQSEKSKGLAPAVFGAAETAAETHAILRAKSGFDINQLAAEYRALRASVLQLWTDECGPGGINVDDLIRFNEAIDQALAESINFFSANVEESRNLMLGMLAHDMRSPLQTMQMTASYLAGLNAGDSISQAANRLINSGARVKVLLDDLLDFNRTKLGLGIKIAPSEVDLARAFRDEVDQLRAAHPDRIIEFEAGGELRGVWDALRLQQVLANLVLNAIKYGTPATPVHVTLRGDEGQIGFAVSNTGPTIEQSDLESIFDPLRRGFVEERSSPGTGFGLGLYIAREIAKSHGGDIRAKSAEAQTIFLVSLPRNHSSSPGAN